jgi:hypothetical protein
MVSRWRLAHLLGGEWESGIAAAGGDHLAGFRSADGHL